MKKKLAALVIALAIIIPACVPTPAYSAAPPTFTTYATRAGWTASEQRVIKCLINRESGWNPKAWNRADPGYGSFGWLQVNMSKGTYGTWTYYRSALGYNIFNLWNPQTNLTIAKNLSVRSARMFGDKWRPWRPLGACR